MDCGYNCGRGGRGEGGETSQREGHGIQVGKAIIFQETKHSPPPLFFFWMYGRPEKHRGGSEGRSQLWKTLNSRLPALLLFVVSREGGC